MELVHSTIIHPAGNHPTNSPIIKDMMAVQQLTDNGERWFGVKDAKINSELRVIFVPISDKDEVINKYPSVPEDRIE